MVLSCKSYQTDFKINPELNWNGAGVRIGEKRALYVCCQLKCEQQLKQRHWRLSGTRRDVAFPHLFSLHPFSPPERSVRRFIPERRRRAACGVALWFELEAARRYLKRQAERNRRARLVSSKWGGFTAGRLFVCVCVCVCAAAPTASLESFVLA